MVAFLTAPLAWASDTDGIPSSGIVEIDGLTFIPSITDLPWCRPDTNFAYKGARNLVDEGSTSKLFPRMEVFGKRLKKACPQARTVAYTTVSTIGNPRHCCFAARSSDFVPDNWDNVRAALPDEPVYACDRLAAHPYDITVPKGVEGLLEPKIEAEKAVAACRKDAADHPDLMRLHFQLGRALLMSGDHDAAFKALQVADRGGHALAILYSGHAYANGWGVKKDLGPANMLWLAGRNLGGHTPDARQLEIAVAAATNTKARYICPLDVDDRECAEREYWAQFKSGLGEDEHRRIERQFADVPEGFKEIFIRLYAADYPGLEQLKREHVVAGTSKDTAVGLVSGLFTGLKDRINEAARTSRWEPVVAQYMLIKTNAFGLCGQQGRQFAVDHKTVTTWRNGYGVVLSQTTEDRGRTYFEIPAQFADIISRAKTTGEAAGYANGIRAMIKRNGGCRSTVLDQLEANMLKYQSWSP